MAIMKFLGLALLLASQNVAASGVFTLHSGDITGSYYPMSVVICREINARHPRDEVFCNVEPSGGSMDNIATLKQRGNDFVLVQSDVAHHAYNGTRRFQNDAYPELRAVMAIYPEVLTLVVKQDAGIKTLMDIKGKRIGLGNEGSGTRITVNDLFGEAGLSESDLAEAAALNPSQSVTAMENDQVDGYFFMVGHPSFNINVLAGQMKIALVPLEGEAVDSLASKYPYYIKAEIPPASYEKFQKPVQGVGVKAVLVTESGTPDERVKLIIKTMLENFWLFKRQHPLLYQKAVTEKNLLEGIAIPLHPAAEEYYREVGLME